MGKMVGLKTNEFIENSWLLLLRVVIGATMLTHGIPKFQMLLAEGEIMFPDPLGFGVTWALVLAVFAEVLCSVMLILGIASRWASIPLIITMSVAFFSVHARDPFAKKEMALIYLLVYLTILVFGSGRFSLGRLIRGK